jgi:class 3 adenylate cyclase/pimeloyl-ACP methyl ester carboxylesterase
MDVPETKYAKTRDGLSIAYQVLGNGAIDLLYVPGIVSHVEVLHEVPGYDEFMARLTSFARVVVFDKRGQGLSDRMTGAPSLEERMEDLNAVMEAVGSKRAAIVAVSEGTSMAALFAATKPHRTTALIVCGGSARFSSTADYSFGVSQEAFDFLRGPWTDSWGSGASLPMFGASVQHDATIRAAWAKLERYSATPTTMRAVWDVADALDVRAVLPAIQVPTLILRRADEALAPASQYLADHITGSRLVTLPGADHYPWFGDSDAVVDEIEEFLTGARSLPPTERVLATVAFTDIVGSTAHATRLGDKKWAELLSRHDLVVTRELERYRGRKVNPTGDGVLASFDGPARAVRCAQAITEAVRPLGIEVRAGLHTGEVELRGDDIGGIAVHIGQRVSALAGPGEVLVSRTVTDLVAGSGLEFEARGEHELKGVPGKFAIYAVRS